MNLRLSGMCFCFVMDEGGMGIAYDCSVVKMGRWGRTDEWVSAFEASVSFVRWGF